MRYWNEHIDIPRSHALRVPYASRQRLEQLEENAFVTFAALLMKKVLVAQSKQLKSWDRSSLPPTNFLSSILRLQLSGSRQLQNFCDDRVY